MPLSKTETGNNLFNGHVILHPTVALTTIWPWQKLIGCFKRLTPRTFWVVVAILLVTCVISTLELFPGSLMYVGFMRDNSDVTISSSRFANRRRPDRPPHMQLNLPVEVDNPEIDCANRDNNWDGDDGDDVDKEEEEDIGGEDRTAQHQSNLDKSSRSNLLLNMDYRISERNYLINTSIRQNHELNRTAVYFSLDAMRAPQFMPAYRNPCWAEELTSGNKYDKNLFNYRKFFRQLEQVWARRLRRGQWWRLRCVPYFHIAGFPKSGTTDLYYKLSLHPSIVRGAVKEPHWWTRQRVGRRRYYDEVLPKIPFMDYVSLYDNAAECIRVRKRSLRAVSSKTNLDLLTGDGSASTFWDNSLWREMPENAGLEEPRTLVIHYIRHVNPAARFIVIMRDPTERLYSDYLYFRHQNQSIEDFHQKVVKSIKKFNECLQNNTLRTCVYDCAQLSLPVRLCVGLYAVYIRDWLGVFPHHQLHVIRSEDYLANGLQTLNAAYTFLGLDHLPTAIGSGVSRFPRANTRSSKNRAIGPMAPATKLLLNQFYSPYNAALAHILRNKKFLWKNSH